MIAFHLIHCRVSFAHVGMAVGVFSSLRSGGGILPDAPATVFIGPGVDQE